jgi:hypothetical protein
MENALLLEFGVQVGLKDAFPNYCKKRTRERNIRCIFITGGYILIRKKCGPVCLRKHM